MSELGPSGTTKPTTTTTETGVTAEVYNTPPGRSSLVAPRVQNESPRRVSRRGFLAAAGITAGTVLSALAGFTMGKDSKEDSYIPDNQPKPQGPGLQTAEGFHGELPAGMDLDTLTQNLPQYEKKTVISPQTGQPEEKYFTRNPIGSPTQQKSKE